LIGPVTSGAQGFDSPTEDVGAYAYREPEPRPMLGCLWGSSWPAIALLVDVDALRAWQLLASRSAQRVEVHPGCDLAGFVGRDSAGVQTDACARLREPFERGAGLALFD
jgi:hypothetical protein